MSTEFWCLEQRCRDLRVNGLPIINKVTGFNQYKYYRKNSLIGGYLRLNREVKRPFVDDMQDEAHKNGMRFYVSDAHFKERCDNGSCCGLPESFNYVRGQFGQASVLCRKGGRVTWPEISGDMEHLKCVTMENGVNIGTSRRRAQFKGFSLYDYLNFLWNNPNMGQSPYRMFEGVMKPVGKDEEGDLVYVLDESKL